MKFPPILLDMMNTKGEHKKLRTQAYLEHSDPYARIARLKELIAEQEAKDVRNYDA